MFVTNALEGLEGPSKARSSNDRDASSFFEDYADREVRRNSGNFPIRRFKGQ